MRALLLAACAAFSLSTAASAADCHFYSFSENKANHTGDAQVDKHCNPKSAEFKTELRRFNREHPGFLITINPAAYDKHNPAGYYPIYMKSRHLQIPDRDEPRHVCSSGISYKVYPSGKRVLERALEGACIVRER